MTPPDPSLEDIARLIPRDHSRALVMLFAAVGIAIGSVGFYALSARAGSTLTTTGVAASASLACPDSARAHAEEKAPALPTFDSLLLAQRIEHDLESLDISACARPGGPVGPGRVNVQFSNDGSVTTSEIVMETRQGAFTARFWESPPVAGCIKNVYAKARIAPFVGDANHRMARVAFVLAARDRPFDEDAAARALDGVDLSSCRVPGVLFRGTAEIILFPDGRVRAEDVSAGLLVPRGGEEPRDAARRTAEASRCVTRAYGRAHAQSFSGTEILTSWWFEVRDSGQ